MTQYDMGAAEAAAYDTRRSQARQAYANMAAQNTFSSGQAGLGYGRSVRDLTRKFDQMRSRLPGGFARRGLLNSGIYGSALQNYATNRANTMNDLQQQLAGTQGQYALQGQMGENTLNTALAAIQAEQDARRADLAAQLREIM